MSPEGQHAIEIDEVEVGEPRVSLRTIYNYKIAKGLGARARLPEGLSLPKTTPLLKPFADHARDRFPEKAEVLDQVRHGSEGYMLPSHASSKAEAEFRNAGKDAAREQRRKEHLLIASEDKLMADYVDLCTQECNLLDEEYYDAASKVVGKAVLVTKLIQQIRMNWLDARKGVVNAAVDIATDSVPRRWSFLP